MIFIFFLSLAGYMSFLSTKVTKTYVPVLTLSLIGLCIYIGGIFHILQIMAYIVLLIGMILGIIAIKRINIKRLSFPYCSLWTLCFMIIAILFFILSLFLKFDHFDNFSHWGIVVKNMLTNHRFPEARDMLIAFKDYPLGMSSLIYYFCLFLGNNQGIMIMCQNMFIFSCFYAMFGIIEEKKRFLLYVILSTGCTFMIYLNITIRIQNLLVDFILPLLTLAICSYIYHQRDDLMSALYLIPLLGFLTVIKEIGFFFMLIAFIYWQWYCWHSSVSLMQKLIMTITILLMSLLPFLLWKYHMSITFAGITHKFDLLSKTISVNQYPTMILFFFQSLFHLSNRSTQTFLFFEILVIGLLIFHHFLIKKKWQLKKVWLLGHMIVVVYVFGLLGMYLFSMPEDEAIRLAGMERYICSIVVFYVGMIMMTIVKDIERSFYIQLKDSYHYKAFYSPQTKKIYQNTTLVFMIITFSCVYSELCELIALRQNHSSSLASQVEQLVGDQWYSRNQMDLSRYLVIASNQNQQVSQYQLSYTMKYFLYAPYVDTLSYLNEDIDIESYDYVIIFNRGYVDEAVIKKYPVFCEEGIYKIKR